ncbi:hypothetical protein FRC16_005138 [Serendipita sp. 398]|nr:hypothetical protein FRC16_005138 [Serendipita sp. 398]
MDNNPEKLSTGRASDDDADSDFDVGDETKKRQPRVRREEDMEEEHEEAEQTENNRNESAATQDEVVDLWAEPTTEPGNAASGDKSRGGRGKPSRGRGEPGSRGRGSKDRGAARGRGGVERGRGGSDRGRGGSDRGRGGERARGITERGRGERGRGRGGTRGGTPKATLNETQNNPDDNTPSNVTEATSNTVALVSNDVSKPLKPQKQEGKGKRPPKSQLKQNENANGTSQLVLPGTEQEGTWGITPAADNESDPAPKPNDDTSEGQKPTEDAIEKAPGWGDEPMDDDWGTGVDPGWNASSPVSPTGDNAGTKAKRVPIYLNRERVKTGGSDRVKPTDEELAQKMERIRLQNEKIKEKKLEVDADAEQFAAEQAEIQQRQKAQAKIQADINEERRKIADKKIAQAQRREWDSGKPGIDEDQEGSRGRGSRGRGGMRGRARGRGRGRGRLDEGPGEVGLVPVLPFFVG